MTAPYRLYGAELSPYSVKVRSYMRYKNIPFEWLPRTEGRQEEFARFAKLPLIPLLVDAEDIALQDSTPIIETLEARYPDPSIHPPQPALGFVSALIEDYADEWLNKAMFHYRWTYPENQRSAARRIVEQMFGGATPPEGLEESVAQRMAGRLHHVGSSPETASVIEASFERLTHLLDRMLSRRAYMLGGRPSLADFGLAGQLAQLLSDPTPGAMLKARAPNVVRWVDRMENPDVEGEFVSLEVVRDDISELLRSEIAGVYLPWMDANARAVAEDDSFVRLELEGRPFVQKPQRYAAKALAELRRKRAAAASDEALREVLVGSGCEPFLSAEAPEGDDEQD